jgi:hypothetical protein
MFIIRLRFAFVWGLSPSELGAFPAAVSSWCFCWRAAIVADTHPIATDVPSFENSSKNKRVSWY